VRVYRPATVLVGVALVILAGMIRLAEPDQRLDDVSRYTIRGSLNQPVAGKDFTLTVTRVKLAREIDPKPDDDDTKARPDDQPVRTRGIFVTVEYTIEGRRQQGSAGDATLQTDGGAVYVPIRKIIRSGVNIPPPGFAESSSMVFEANPDDLAGLTLLVRQARFLTTTTEDYAVDLGVPDEAAARGMVDKAERSYPLPTPTMRAVQ
jgi:hypothetical protein